MRDRPSLFIFSGSTGMTGGLIAAIREAQLIADLADVTIAIPDHADIDEKAIPVQILRLPFAQPRTGVASVAAYPFQLLKSGLALRRAMARRNCQRLQVNDFTFLEGVVSRLLGFRGKIVTWVRIDPRRSGWIGNIWLRMARWASNDLVAVSDHILALLPPRYRAHRLYDPLALSARARHICQSRRFLFLGNYTDGKGQDLALRAFSKIAGDHPEATLSFYGSDLGLQKNRRYRARLRHVASDLKIVDRVTFNGFASNPSPLFEDSLAVLNLSDSESFSLVCQEASAHGVPVIATRSGGPEEIIADGETGYLVPRGDVAAVADRMSKLLADPSLADRLGNAAAIHVRERFPEAPFIRAVASIFSLERPCDATGPWSSASPAEEPATPANSR